MSNKVVCIKTADWHLTIEPPAARSAESDWLAVQLRYVNQVKALMKKHDAPLVHAGDVLDRHDPKPELLNWCIANLPVMYAIPGQHDLRHHSYADLRKTGFWTLVEAGKIVPLQPGVPLHLSGGLVLHGVPWGEQLRKLGEPFAGKWINLAVMHRYVWWGIDGHPGAKDEDHISGLYDALKENGYSCAVVGDNHKGFLCNKSPPVFVPGTFLRRKQDERNNIPCVGLLHADGTITQKFFDTSEDKFTDVPEGVASLLDGKDVGGLIQELRGLGDGGLDFLESLRRTLSSVGVPEEVRRIVLQCAEGKK